MTNTTKLSSNTASRVDGAQESSRPLIDSKARSKQKKSQESAPKEIGGPKGLEPTRYGDWESKGRCYDF